MSNLWNRDCEKDFFIKSLEFASLDQLFYKGDSGKYFAYWPKKYKGKKTTLQSRNALIGNYTERWCQKLIKPLVEDKGYYVVQDVVCPDIGLIVQSKGDLAICKGEGSKQRAEDILLIFEVKMSIVWNWEMETLETLDSLKWIGDFTTHQGTPSIQRSDSMLKAIGKSIKIRVSSHQGSKIPIIILGNAPITKNYYNEVDNLKKCGVIQGFWSLNPEPLTGKLNIKATPQKGFIRMNSVDELKENINGLLESDLEFFSAMKTKNELGKIIEIADRETSLESKAEKFLSLIRNSGDLVGQ